MPRAKGQIVQDEATWLYEQALDTYRYFGNMHYAEDTINTKKSNMRDILGLVSLRLGREALVSDIVPEDLLELGLSMEEREFEPTTIQSRCSNLQHDLIGGGLGAWRDGTPFGMRRLDQVQRRLRVLARQADVRKAQLIYSSAISNLEPAAKTALCLWCLSGFRRSSWNFLCSVSGKPDQPLVIRSRRAKVLPWSRPCCALVGCNCRSGSSPDLCPLHKLCGETVDVHPLIGASKWLMAKVGGSGHSARRTMAFWMRHIFEQRELLFKCGAIPTAAVTKLKRAINLSMGWAESSDMLFSTYTIDYDTHDANEVLDLYSGAINSVLLSLETLGLGNSKKLTPTSFDTSVALDILSNEEFDPI